jgi:phosphatidylglycerol:prolipoprotein diacylglycerol transferase
MHPDLIEIPLPGGGACTIHSYGFMVMCGFLLCLWLLPRRGRKAGLSAPALLDAAVYSLLGGIVGARIYYVIYAWDYFQDNLWQIIRIDRGGLVFYGGLIGGGVAMLGTLLWKKLPLRRSLDIVASLVPLGHAFGRVGCFLNGCCFGGVTRSFLGVRFPQGSPVFAHQVRQGLISAGRQWSLPVHPTQLYAVGYNLVIFGILSYLLARDRPAGEVAWLYAILYGTARFVNEFIRADQPAVAAGLTAAQIICVLLVAFGVVMMVISRRSEPQPGLENGAGEGQA